MSRASKLTLQPWNAEHGRGFDVVINGMPLRERLRRHEGDSVDYIAPQWDREWSDRLAMRASPDMPDGRTSILVCPLCQDLGCGAVSAIIRRAGSDVVWDQLGVSNNLPVDDGSPWLFEKVTSFRFEWEAYLRALGVSKTV